MSHPSIRSTLTGLSILLLTACGGGGSSSSVAPPPPPPPPTADIVAFGPLTDVANFTVNGTRYATNGAVVAINGAPAAVSDLKAGQVVRVRGETTGNNTARALEIAYDAQVIGPVDAVDLAGGLIVVMGQRVRVSDDTILDAALDANAVGLTAEISGHVDAQSDIAATRVDLVTDTGQQRVMGTATAVDNANFVFRINGLTLDYSAATVIDVPGGEVTEGMELIVSGVLSGSGVLNAAGIDNLERDTASFSGFTASLTGVVTRFASGGDFDTAGFRVLADGQTEYINGAAGDLRLGVTTRIVGRINTAGWLLADQVSFSTPVGGAGTVEFAIDNFTGVTVEGPFVTTIDEAPGFSVRLTVDSHVVDLLDIRRDGTELKIGFRENVNVNASTLRAEITLPHLDALTLAGATYATVTGFEGPHLQVALAGAVFLDVNASVYGSLAADLVGACALLMDGSTLTVAADVDLVAASTATVNLMPGANLRGSSVAASALLYYGNDIDVDVSHDFTSTVQRLGSSR